MAVLKSIDGKNTQQPDLDGVTSQFRVEWFSGSGAGGQHRNKVQNCCRITHNPTGLVRKAETRSRESSYRYAMEALAEALRQQVENKTHGEQNSLRQNQIGSGMRGDKRRTYRFQENSVTDHITNRGARCNDVMRGHFDLLWPK